MHKVRLGHVLQLLCQAPASAHAPGSRGARRAIQRHAPRQSICRERIYSVRYVGPTAYVVTFRQTDPFYTVDLSNPTAPRVVGELKIPGYSGYLHPIGTKYVLGIGQDANAQGRISGTKVTLFDVTDLANPTEVATWKQTGSNTQAEYDHHAFLYWDDRKIAVLPTSANNGTNAAVVLSIDPQRGITEVGRITGSPSDPIVRSLVAADQLR